jgi:hypothetical protein
MMMMQGRAVEAVMMLAALENLHGCVEVFLYNRTMLPCAECLTDSVVCKAVVDGVRDRLSREVQL